MNTRFKRHELDPWRKEHRKPGALPRECFGVSFSFVRDGSPRIVIR